MSKAKALQQLGFEPQVDFRLYDHSDGNGQQMEWLSSDPQPSDAEIAVGQAAWEEEQSSKAARLVSAKSKLEALGLTTEEVQEAFGL
jgi:hypothetical protein|tara:strand:- start:194 stop:454 length:261 start_codon:yes stop_codon:yes gene_type:complete